MVGLWRDKSLAIRNFYGTGESTEERAFNLAGIFETAALVVYAAILEEYRTHEQEAHKA